MTTHDNSSDPHNDAEEKDVLDWIVKAQRPANLDRLSAFSAYQRQMDRYPQLTPSLVDSLFAQVRLGEDADAALKAEKETGKRIPARKRRTVVQQSREGAKAVEAVAGSMFRLTLVICRELAERRYGREKAADMLGDLVGEANVALMKSIRDFDPTRGPGFPTYAARVIRNQVRYTIGRDGMIKPTSSWARMRRIASVRIPQLATELGRQPTDSEVRDNLMDYCREWAFEHLSDAEKDMPEEVREELMVKKLKRQGMIGALNNLADVQLTSQPVASLDAPLAGTDDAYLVDTVSEKPSDGFDPIEQKELSEQLAEALRALPEREQRIMHLRYGFEPDGVEWTYKLISEEFDVTQERIRQIERQVLKKLRLPSQMRDKLAAFLPGVSYEDMDD